MGVRRTLRRGSRAARSSACDRCGSELTRQQAPKYDPFWTTALIFAGALTAFYLVGLLMIAAGLWMRTRRIARQVCPVCVTASPTPAAL